MRSGRESRARLRRLEKRLRELHDAYYTDASNEAAVIQQYLRVLAEARGVERMRHPEPARGPRLHLGAGDHRLEGWLNADLLGSSAVDLRADCAGPLPFRDGAVAFIHCEDLLEHLDLAGGKTLLAECFRILKPGGVLRLLTPDLERLIHSVYERRDPRHLRWCADRLSADGPCEALNMHLRMNGEHRFVYDSSRLREVLGGLGFSVRRVRWNRSSHPELRFLDLRDFGLNLFLEATKPGAPTA
ncbi:MAG TPA: methyltransferase domain-containing protein [Thermoanaerobaculia bacterium]|jgi:predicted SAM-dependent methyltransferase